MPRRGITSPEHGPASELLGSRLPGTAPPRSADNDNNGLRTFLPASCRQNNSRSYFWLSPANMFALLRSPLRHR